ncbi:acid-sensing ion channel 1-like isoform X1 [Varroa destructor]|uniref:Amiloride-sensitive sodium channel n=2 Tax=Varroa TaxID=62624 RepID=A0A7M7JPR0_VARDE|nr:acid-sensing ion channel 1-like isoform X1 [Varroa destructor]
MGVIQEYMQYPVIYTYEYKTVDTLEFPDVTICNVNPLLKSKACRNDSLLYRSVKIDNLGEEVTLNAFCPDENSRWMCDRICGDNEQVKQPNEEDLNIRAQLAQWIKETIAAGEMGDAIITDLGHKVGSMVQKCSYASNDDCTTNTGLRFTETVSQLYGSCFCFHCHRRNHTKKFQKLSEEDRAEHERTKREWDKYYEYGTLSSPLSGLVIQLNTEIDEYLPTSNEVGFVVMIHEHNKDYSICHDSVYILPGYTTYIGLNLMTTFNLGPPYQDSCRDVWPQPLKEGTLEGAVKVIDPFVETQQYSRPMCLEYCKIEYLLFKCKCVQNDPTVKINPELTENYKYCKSAKKNECTKKVLYKKTNMVWEARCDCRRECETRRYDTDVSVAGLVAEENTGLGNQTREQQMYTQMGSARIVVYFHSFTYEHVKAIKKYDEIRVLSIIGGINGMYLGLSFYLLFQAVDIIATGAVKFIQKLRNRNLALGQDGNSMSSTAVQTTARGNHRRRWGSVWPSYTRRAPEPLPEVSYYGRQRKNIWDVFKKPSEHAASSTIEQFNTSYGRFAVHYYRR